MYAVQLWLKNENEVLTRCETIYASEKGTVTKEELKAANPDYGFIDEVQEEYPEFDSIRAEIMSMLNDVRNILLDDNKSLQYGKGVHICVDNCKANKEAEEGTTLRIVYPTDEQMATMEKDPVFLVIGGNTLARGLTIDGLVCSYFSRNSNQADTLMQMARWFGYRKGFELMQRIWMTESVLKKFEDLSQIDMDMKEEIEQFMERGISPELFGPRIRNIPEIKSFRITSKKKSQQAEYDDFDFSGDTYETTDFDNGDVLKKNIEVADAFIDRISQISKREVSKTVKAFVWRNIDYRVINDEFISKYVISPNSGLNVNIPIYRDAIVYQNGAEPYERTMFGAYVLFPYANEDEYRTHNFFESIDKVNIGGLPFLPSATGMVKNMLDALISDSPNSAFERATLPRGIEDKLTKTDWKRRDVLAGALRNRSQLETSLKHKFYHIPAAWISESDLPIHYVAIYQSINLFGKEAGIRYYGEVIRCSLVKRREIREIPKNSDELYYRLEIKEWKEMNVPLVAKEVRDFPFFTNMFLLQHCSEVPNLRIKTAEEYRLYTELKRLSQDSAVNDEENTNGFMYNDKMIVLENGNIQVIASDRIMEQVTLESFSRKPSAVFSVIKNFLNSTEEQNGNSKS